MIDGVVTAAPGQIASGLLTPMEGHVTLHVYVDESDRGRQDYLVGAFPIDPSDAPALRTDLRALLRPGMVRLHMKNEKDPLKRKILSTIARADANTVMYAASHRLRREGRAEILRRIVSDLGADRLILESRAEQDYEDTRVLYDAVRKAGKEHVFDYVHMSPRAEPLLWVPDALAWAYGKRGEWRRRAMPSIDQVIKILEP